VSFGSPSPETWYRIKIRGRTASSALDGVVDPDAANVSIKTWRAGEPEPAAYQVNRTVGLNFSDGELVVRGESPRGDVYLDEYTVRTATAQIADADGDGLSDELEREGIPIGTGERVRTDPSDADTDGDGIGDRAELRVSDVRTHPDHGGTYVPLRANPADNDTDGDGLRDGAELNGRTTVVTTRNASASRAVATLQDPANLTANLVRYNNTSDPLVADTDGDGLSDAEERRLGTDPGRPDTDGDGALDGDEALGGFDPTMYDFLGPEIAVKQASFRTPRTSADTRYNIDYVVTDETAATRTRVLKGGTARYTREFEDAQADLRDPSFEAHWVDARFRTGAGETLLDSVAGTEVTVAATDVHDNERRTVGLERPNFYGSLAGELEGGGIGDAVVAEKLGELSGFSASLGATARSVVDLIGTLARNPAAVVENLGEILRLLNRVGLGIVERLVDAAVESFQDRQERNNPYDNATEPTLHGAYKFGYYRGYAGGFVAKTVVGASASRAIRSTRTVRRVERALGSTRVGRVLATVDGVKRTAKTRVATKLAERRGVPGDYVSEADSVGATYRLWRVQRRAEFDIDNLNAAEQRELARFVASSDRGSRTLLTRFDEDTVRELFDDGLCPGVGVAGAGSAPVVLGSTDGTDGATVSTAARDRCSYRSLFLSETLPESNTAGAGRIADAAVDNLRDGDLRDFMRLANNVGDPAFRLARRADLENDDNDLATVLELRRRAEYDRGDVDEFVGAAGPESGELLGRADPEIRRRTFDLELDRFGDDSRSTDWDAGEFRSNLLRQATDPSTSGPPVRRYLNDLETVRRGIDDGIEVENPAGLIADISDDSSDYIGQAFETRRVAHYVKQARDGRTTRIVSEYDGDNGGKDVDYRIVRTGDGPNFLNVEAKSPRNGLDLSTIRDNMYSSDLSNNANAKFTDVAPNPANNEARVLEIENREEGGLSLGDPTDVDDIRETVRRRAQFILNNDELDLNIDHVCIIGPASSKVFSISRSTSGTAEVTVSPGTDLCSVGR
jgi:hypothetical protein